MIGTLVDEFAFAVEAGKVREFARAIQAPSDGVPLTFSVVAGHYRDARAAVGRPPLISSVTLGETLRCRRFRSRILRPSAGAAGCKDAVAPAPDLGLRVV